MFISRGCLQKGYICACLCVCTCLCLFDWLGAIACVSADSAVELYAVVFFVCFCFFSLPHSLSQGMTVADSQFTPPLAMLNLKVMASGVVCPALKKPAAVLFRVLPRPFAWPRTTAPALTHEHANHPQSTVSWSVLPTTDCQPR